MASLSRIVLAVSIVLVPGFLVGQSRRTLWEVGVGSLSPNDPFAAELGMRAAAGWVAGTRTAFTIEYSRQSANRSEGIALGTVARHFLGIGWQHAFRDAFADQVPLRQQYLLRAGVGLLLSRAFPEAVGGDRLKPAPFLAAGLIIRYPFSHRLAAVGSIEDALVFFPRQSVRSYCGFQSGFLACEPRGGTTFYTHDVGGRVQQNFALLATLELRL